MLAELEAVLGKSAVRDVEGRPAVTLADETGARALTALCRERGGLLHPWTAREPPSPGLPAEAVLVTPGPDLAGELSVAVGDAYCDVPATMTLAELAVHLAGTPLWFPFASPGGITAGIAAVVARYPANAFAPAYGELPRLLFGVTFVNDDGEVVSPGRRTIKGVAGYDLAKVFLGSRGRAGLITRVRFRLFPRPRAAALWRTRGRIPEAGGRGGRLCRGEGGTLLYADGPAADVDAVGERLRRAYPGLGEVSRGGEATADFVAAVAASPRPPAGRAGTGGPVLSDLFV